MNHGFSLLSNIHIVIVDLKMLKLLKTTSSSFCVTVSKWNNTNRYNSMCMTTKYFYEVDQKEVVFESLLIFVSHQGP